MLRTQFSSRILKLCILSLVAVLTACGGGGGDSDGGGTASRSFIRWANNVNDTIVLDSSGESFSFFTDTRCLYSHQTGRETTNYCVGANGQANFAGTAIVVMGANSTTSAGCVAVLASPDGRSVDIYTDSSGTTNFTITSRRWSAC
jgi:hypothetical protein